MTHPSVSFVIVALNAEKSLPLLLDDLTNQDISSDRLEVILTDSLSSDSTADIMREYQAHSRFKVQVLSNPKRWLASGCNVSLRAAAGDYIIRVDAHARIPSDFISKNLAAMSLGEHIVGGSVVSTAPAGNWETVLRMLDTSRFCGGAAPFRNAGSARYVDTLAYALYDRKVYDTVGFYDERLRRTEDNEMHYRMKKAGYRFYFSPDIVSSHTARDSLRGQLRQKWGNGYWIGRTMHFEPKCFAPRHLIPAFFVLSLFLFLLCGLLFSWIPFFLILSLYFLFDAVFTVLAFFSTAKAKFRCLLLLPFLFPLVHIVYGTGTLLGLLTPERKQNA